jgi:hypothetical protein
MAELAGWQVYEKVTAEEDKRERERIERESSGD